MNRQAQPASFSCCCAIAAPQCHHDTTASFSSQVCQQPAQAKLKVWSCIVAFTIFTGLEVMWPVEGAHRGAHPAGWLHPRQLTACVGWTNMTQLRALQTNMQWHTQTPDDERVTPTSSSKHQQQQRMPGTGPQQWMDVRRTVATQSTDISSLHNRRALMSVP
jgi:hypothetical protein